MDSDMAAKENAQAVVNVTTPDKDFKSLSRISNASSMSSSHSEAMAKVSELNVIKAAAEAKLNKTSTPKSVSMKRAMSTSGASDGGTSVAASVVGMPIARIAELIAVTEVALQGAEKELQEANAAMLMHKMPPAADPTYLAAIKALTAKHTKVQECNAKIAGLQMELNELETAHLEAKEAIAKDPKEVKRRENAEKQAKQQAERDGKAAKQKAEKEAKEAEKKAKEAEKKAAKDASKNVSTAVSPATSVDTPTERQVVAAAATPAVAAAAAPVAITAVAAVPVTIIAVAAVPVAITAVAAVPVVVPAVAATPVAVVVPAVIQVAPEGITLSPVPTPAAAAAAVVADPEIESAPKLLTLESHSRDAATDPLDEDEYYCLPSDTELVRISVPAPYVPSPEEIAAKRAKMIAALPFHVKLLMATKQTVGKTVAATKGAVALTAMAVNYNAAQMLKPAPPAGTPPPIAPASGVGSVSPAPTPAAASPSSSAARQAPSPTDSTTAAAAAAPIPAPAPAFTTHTISLPTSPTIKTSGGVTAGVMGVLSAAMGAAIGTSAPAFQKTDLVADKEAADKKAAAATAAAALKATADKEAAILKAAAVEEAAAKKAAADAEMAVKKAAADKEAAERIAAAEQEKAAELEALRMAAAAAEAARLAAEAEVAMLAKIQDRRLATKGGRMALAAEKQLLLAIASDEAAKRYTRALETHADGVINSEMSSEQAVICANESYKLVHVYDQFEKEAYIEAERYADDHFATVERTRADVAIANDAARQAATIANLASKRAIAMADTASADVARAKAASAAAAAAADKADLDVKAAHEAARQANLKVRDASKGVVAADSNIKVAAITVDYATRESVISAQLLAKKARNAEGAYTKDASRMEAEGAQAAASLESEAMEAAYAASLAQKKLEAAEYAAAQASEVLEAAAKRKAAAMLVLATAAQTTSVTTAKMVAAKEVSAKAAADAEVATKSSRAIIARAVNNVTHSEETAKNALAAAERASAIFNAWKSADSATVLPPVPVLAQTAASKAVLAPTLLDFSTPPPTPTPAASS